MPNSLITKLDFVAKENVALRWIIQYCQITNWNGSRKVRNGVPVSWKAKMAVFPKPRCMPLLMVIKACTT